MYEARQAQQDALRRQQVEAQIESTEALTAARRERARQEREAANAKVAALKKTERGISQLRSELVAAGMPEASMWPADRVEDAHQELIDRRFAEMFPDPEKPPTTRYQRFESDGQQFRFNPLTGTTEPIPGAPVEAPAPKIDKATQADIESVVSTLDALGAAQRFPGLLAEVRAELAGIADPVRRKMRADEILAAASRAQRQSMGLE